MGLITLKYNTKYSNSTGYFEKFNFFTTFSFKPCIKLQNLLFKFKNYHLLTLWYM